MPPREQILFDAARRLTDARQRDAFLDLNCEGDAELRRRIVEALAWQAEEDIFFGPEPDALLRVRVTGQGHHRHKLGEHFRSLPMTIHPSACNLVSVWFEEMEAFMPGPRA